MTNIKISIFSKLRYTINFGTSEFATARTCVLLMRKVCATTHQKRPFLRVIIVTVVLRTFLFINNIPFVDQSVVEHAEYFVTPKPQHGHFEILMFHVAAQQPSENLKSKREIILSSPRVMTIVLQGCNVLLWTRPSN